MRRLTKVEEKQILKEALMYGQYLGNGSSRVVYSLGNGKVVKVAYDRKGQYQNHIEIETFGQYGKSYLAEIYAYGKYIVVAEEVDADGSVEEAINDYNYYVDDGISCDGEVEIYGLTGDQIQEAMDVKDQLDWILGCTADNYQLGVRKDGAIVAYDYGYQPDEHDMSVSEELDWFLCEECSYDYDYFLNYTISRF